jgi:hypothetical protein
VARALLCSLSIPTPAAAAASTLAKFLGAQNKSHRIVLKEHQRKSRCRLYPSRSLFSIAFKGAAASLALSKTGLEAQKALKASHATHTHAALGPLVLRTSSAQKELIDIISRRACIIICHAEILPTLLNVAQIIVPIF